MPQLAMGAFNLLLEWVIALIEFECVIARRVGLSPHVMFLRILYVYTHTNSSPLKSIPVKVNN